MNIVVLRVITEELTVIAIQLPYRLELLFSKKESSDMMYSLPKDLLTHRQSIVSKSPSPSEVRSRSMRRIVSYRCL